jgi:amino acid adenylation domain-containing protein
MTAASPQTALEHRLSRPPTGREPTARGLHSGFLRSAAAYPDRPALTVERSTYSYAALRARAAALAATIDANAPPGPRLAAVFAYRTVTAFSAVLGTLLAGKGYVPLNRTLPPARTRLMLERSGASVIVVDEQSAAQLDVVLAGRDERFLVVAPDMDDVRALRRRLRRHIVLGRADLEDAGSWTPARPDPDAVAYVLFTSGSTGVPKGVTVAHRNVTGLLDHMVARYGVGPDDRVSQTHELTFDVSVWDMFVCWQAGACLCCPTQKELIKPGGFIRHRNITIWFSVPSTAVFMKRLGMLRPNSYPSLRYSLFAGEPLPVAVAQGWLAAAPHAIVENLYGPTELTIVCMGHRWVPGTSEAAAEAGVVPIGEPLAGNEPLVVDAQLREVPAGETGELLVAGSQVTLGYWRDPERTAQAFVVPPGRDRVHYRTGDRVRRPRAGAPMTYLGRLDQQIKIRGIRVELGEAEAAVREATGVDAVVAVGWPRTATGYEGIVAFIGATDVDVRAARARLRARLPAHMIPRRFVLLDRLPLNASGKFDRQALLRSLGDDGNR